MEKNTEGLFTSALAISANPSEATSEQMDLGRAAFWVHLRQDVHVALLLQVPINTDYPPCLNRQRIMESLDRITDGETTVRQDTLDCAWANRMVLLLLDVINYSFQPGARSLQDWVGLRGRLDHWSMAKPRNFQSYYERSPDPSDGRVFPDIWILLDCCVLAQMYYHTATILLKTYPPVAAAAAEAGTDVRTGAPSLRDMECREQVLLHARSICGIAVTNPNAQALIVFCHMATISAIFFTEEAEQNETIALLQMAHSVTGHPLHDVQRKLYRAWGRATPT